MTISWLLQCLPSTAIGGDSLFSFFFLARLFFFFFLYLSFFLVRHQDEEPEEQQPQELANFGLSGKLAKDQNTGNVYKGVVLKVRCVTSNILHKSVLV